MIGMYELVRSGETDKIRIRGSGDSAVAADLSVAIVDRTRFTSDESLGPQ
jgi:hypothetical protein